MLIEFKNLKKFCLQNKNKKIYALFGCQLTHSLSFELHNFIINNNFNKHKQIYILVNINQNEFSKVIFFSKKYLSGFNITMPYKEQIINLLDTYNKKLLSINTVKIDNKKLIGYNTDIYGFIYIINKKNISMNKKTILIFGYGGLAKEIIKYIIINNFNAKILVCTRTKVNKKNKKNLYFFNFNNIPKKYDIVINCTPIGMYPNINEKFPINNFYYKTESVIDTIYNPLNTPLIKLCIKNNIQNYSNGLNMLIVQALYANNIWNKKNVLFNIKQYNLFLKICIIKIRLKEVYDKKNIILCGFTSIGKTTLGFILSKILKMNFIDTDIILKKSLNMNIKNIFKYFGEKFFRKIENKLSYYIIKRYINCIISLGGGTINKQNKLFFQQFGLVIFLYSKFNNVLINILKNKKNSPLIKKNLELIFYQRLNLYIQNSDIIININFEKKIDFNINNILKSI